jgi:GntR family transcriptional regulator
MPIETSARSRAPSAAPLPARAPARTALARGSERPLYQQLAALLAQDIRAGRWKPGDRLPSEAELMRDHEVSRITVRQAIALLVRNGQLTARRGKGTFVSSQVVRHALGELQSFYDALRNQGLEPETELLEFSAAAGASDPHRPPELVLPVRLRRRYLLQGKPFAVVEAYLPAAAGELGPERAARLTVYEILGGFLELPVARADMVVRCQRVRADVAAPLGLRRSDSVLVMERQSTTAGGTVCEFMRIHIVPERYEFHVSSAGPLEIVRALRRAPDAAGAPS